MNTFTIKNTEFELVTLTTYENSLSIVEKQGYKTKTTSTTHDNTYVMNISIDSIKTIKYQEATNTTENGNKNKMITFLVIAAILFIVFLVTISGDDSSFVGIIALVGAIICAINALKNKPSSEQKTGAEFAIYDTNDSKVYSTHTLLSREKLEEIIASIRVIQK